MDESLDLELDVDKMLKSALPKLKIPLFVRRYLKKILHESEMQQFFKSIPGVKNREFVKVFLNYFDISCTVIGVENIPVDNKSYIFVSNHPLGLLDGFCLYDELSVYYPEKISIYANEFLEHIKPIKEFLLPVSKSGLQSRKYAHIMDNFFKSENHLITFPAGATSRCYGEKIIDLKWHKNFIQKAINYDRDIIPIHFVARNSKFFYRLEKLREILHLKINIEMLYLVDEIFKQKGNRYKIYIGKPIPAATFDKSKTQPEWANWVKEISYNLTQKI